MRTDWNRCITVQSVFVRYPAREARQASRRRLCACTGVVHFRAFLTKTPSARSGRPVVALRAAIFNFILRIGTNKNISVRFTICKVCLIMQIEIADV